MSKTLYPLVSLDVVGPFLSSGHPDVIRLEISSSFQIPSFHIIGLPGPEVSEARDRVRSAITSSGLEFPNRRVTINLSPSHLKKHDTSADLAIALTILLHQYAVIEPSESVNEGSDSEQTGRSQVWLACAELGLNGSLKWNGRPTRVIEAARKSGATHLLIPRLSRTEGDRLKQSLSYAQRAFPELMRIQIVHADNLSGAWEAIIARASLSSRCSTNSIEPKPLSLIPPADVPFARNTEDTRPSPTRALTFAALDELGAPDPDTLRCLIAALGGQHHLLVLGKRGTGKSRLYDWIQALAPEPRPGIRWEQLLMSELTTGAPSRATLGETSDGPVIRKVGVHTRPQSLIGRVSTQGLYPGEYSLAHGGILFADELPEWHRDSRESLREPLEQGSITLTRTHERLSLPAGFLLFATGNYCPCGNLGTKTSECRCSAAARTQYLARLSAPLLDRIDITFELFSRALKPEAGLAEMAFAQVQDTRAFLLEMHGGLPGTWTPSFTESFITKYRSRWGHPWSHPITGQTVAWFDVHSDVRSAPAPTGGDSLRARHKIVRLATTLAAIDGQEVPSPQHLAEARLLRGEVLIQGLLDQLGLGQAG